MNQTTHCTPDSDTRLPVMRTWVDALPQWSTPQILIRTQKPLVAAMELPPQATSKMPRLAAVALALQPLLWHMLRQVVAVLPTVLPGEQRQLEVALPCVPLSPLWWHPRARVAALPAPTHF